MAQTIKQMQSALDRLIGAEQIDCNRAAAFPGGVGMVGRHRLSRDRSIEASVTRAVKITELSKRLELARRLADGLPALRRRASDIDAIIKSGVLLGRPMTAQQIKQARGIKADVVRSIKRAEHLSQP